MTSWNEKPVIFSYKVMFLSHITCKERPPNFGCASLQKYFFNIQRHKEKTFKDSSIFSELL